VNRRYAACKWKFHRWNEPRAEIDPRHQIVSLLPDFIEDQRSIDEERRDSERRLAISHHDGRYIVVQADAKWAFIDGTERGTVGRRNLRRHGAGLLDRAGEKKKLGSKMHEMANGQQPRVSNWKRQPRPAEQGVANDQGSRFYRLRDALFIDLPIARRLCSGQRSAGRDLRMAV